jgi:CHAT domain-containing protein/Tfp pilus assembly protein PilF
MKTLTAILVILVCLTAAHPGGAQESESVTKEEIRRALDGPETKEQANSLKELGESLYEEARYAAAELAFKRSLAIKEKALGPEHPSTAAGLNDLALLYNAQGRYAEAEPLFKRTLAINENFLGPEHTATAMGLNSLAALYLRQHRFGEAEALYRRTLAIFQKALGETHFVTAISITSLARIYVAQGRYPEAEALYKRSLAINEKVFGPEHPATGSNFNDLAVLYVNQGRYAEAEPLFKRSLAIHEKAFGPDHPNIATGLNNIATIYHNQGRYAQAEPLYKRSLAINEKILGPEHPATATSLNNMAGIYKEQDRYAEALSYRRRGTSILRTRFTADDVQETAGLLSEQRSDSSGFYYHIDLALHPEQDSNRDDLVAEAFDVLQLARSSVAGNAVVRMAARFASGDDAIANVIREQQDKTTHYKLLDAKYLAAVGSPERDGALITSLREQLTELKKRITELNTDIETRFPTYANLTTREPLSLVETQKLLGPDEALLTFGRSWDGDTTHVFVVRSSSIFVYDADLGVEDLDASVSTLRAGIDLSSGRFPTFDRSEAYRLYSELLAPAEDALSDVAHLFVVPEGALNSLPLGVLVTEPPGDAPANDNDGAGQTRGLKVVPKEQQSRAGRFADYLDTPWLARRYAMTTLPSIASLRALRTFAANTRATSPFIGFGDPVLDGGAGTAKGVQVASLFRGALANVDKVRELASLPGTADELRSMARYLKADDNAVYLGERATETMVKKDSLLNNNRVVAFSTHGLISGELSGLSEPALVLTPPDEPTEDDDGLLTASEIALLSMNADWVILSACNTASADGNGGQGLSGLARAFFYAGSRTLLVSHWPVASDATTALTSAMFEAANDNPDAGKAAALQSAMLSLADNDNTAHPALWAPFVIVGEGGANRR